MSVFQLVDDTLHCEGVVLDAVATEYGTPLYVYSKNAIEAAFTEYQQALKSHRHLICYAVKANSNLAVLNCLARLGAGFDIVSGGELRRVIAAGGDPGKIVFSGVAKHSDDIRAALAAGIRCFNIESAPELELVNDLALAAGLVAPISVRVNPDVDAGTHPYISTGLKENKFGVDITSAPTLYRRAAALPGVKPVGIDCHIGSQLLDTAPFAAALERLLLLIDQIESDGIVIDHLDLGGGLGVQYEDEPPPSVAEYINTLLEGLGGRDFELVFEPGRSIVAMAGTLLTRVSLLKPTEHKNFALVDAAMNDLIRPALYGAWQEIRAVTPRTGKALSWDIVGPVCETGDFLGKDRKLALEAGDLLAVMGAGAYGFVMTSNYNTRARPAEVMVDGNSTHLIRNRESVEELFASEHLLPEETP